VINSQQFYFQPYDGLQQNWPTDKLYQTDYLWNGNNYHTNIRK